MLSLRSCLSAALVFAVGCEQEGPGVYSGDPSLSCNEVCAAESLACDELHVWETDFFGFTTSAGGERRYQGPGGRSGRQDLHFACGEVPPESVMIDGDTYEGTSNYECACILGAVDAGADAATEVDAGPQDVGMDVLQDVPLDIVQDVPVDAPPAPGTYAGDVEELRSCEDICTDVGLSCNARNRWPGGFLLPGDPGGCQGSYSNGAETRTDGFGCYAPPPTSIMSYPELQSFRCACINDNSEGDLLNEVEQEVGSSGVYRGLFTVVAPAVVRYEVQDNYELTSNSWTVAIVPSASIDAYLAGEGPLVYGEDSNVVALEPGDYILTLICQNDFTPCRFHTRVVLE
jgi:hypothetical protein